jgi:hypothetical protein
VSGNARNTSVAASTVSSGFCSVMPRRRGALGVHVSGPMAGLLEGFIVRSFHASGN